jgi:hypothetical protein
VEVKIIGGPTTQPYPGNSQAEEVIVLDPVKPEGTVLSEKEAIRRALLTSKEPPSPPDTIHFLAIPVVKSVKYDARTSLWTVSLTDRQPSLNGQFI